MTKFVLWGSMHGVQIGSEEDKRIQFMYRHRAAMIEFGRKLAVALQPTIETTVSAMNRFAEQMHAIDDRRKEEAHQAAIRLGRALNNPKQRGK